MLAQKVVIKKTGVTQMSWLKQQEVKNRSLRKATIVRSYYCNNVEEGDL